MAKKYMVIGGRGNGGGSAEGAVRYDEAQILTSEEQAQARDNIGASDFSGDYTDLTNTPTIPTATSDLNNDSGFITSSDIPAQVQSDWNEADTNDPAYIQNKPTIPAAPVQSNWNEADTNSLAYIQNKPTIPTATSDLNNDSGFITSSDIPAQVQSDWNEVDSNDAAYIKNKPTIPAAPVQSNWNEADSGSLAYIQNKPSLATVATSGSYSDLSNTPTIPTATSDLNNDSGFITSSDIPAQVQSDWNEADSNDPAYIKNKPTIPAAQVNSDWNSESGITEIYNKPELLTEKLTFTLQGGGIVSMNVYYNPGNYFYVENTSNSNQTLSIWKNNYRAPTVEVFTSSDRLNWVSMGSTSTTAMTVTIPANSKLYLKATTDKWGTYNNDNYYNIISCSSHYNVGGNIMSLLYGDNFEGTTFNTIDNIYAFSHLFHNSLYLVNAGNLLLPSTTLANYCYYGMFYGCSSLTTAPELPATTLASACYMNMFENCTSLTSAPATLPATTLAENCYNSMFKGCTSLTTAPTISATTLGIQCCMNMFNGCSALTKAPDLLATDGATPNSQIYTNMFKGCTSLVNPPVIALTSCSSWSLQNMFQNCTSLVRTPVLNITTLKQGCYRYMFDGCTSLTTVTTYANDISSTDCLDNWLNNVAATGDFYNLGGATYTSGASGIPSGWGEHYSF